MTRLVIRMWELRYIAFGFCTAICKTIWMRNVILTSVPEQKTKQQVAQGQYVVSDTRCPALSDCELE